MKSGLVKITLKKILAILKVFSYRGGTGVSHPWANSGRSHAAIWYCKAKPTTPLAQREGHKHEAVLLPVDAELGTNRGPSGRREAFRLGPTDSSSTPRILPRFSTMKSPATRAHCCFDMNAPHKFLSNRATQSDFGLGRTVRQRLFSLSLSFCLYVQAMAPGFPLLAVPAI